jgi:hypothetical protein
MKTRIALLTLIIGLTFFLISGCGGRMDEKVIGTWLIEDIKIDGDTSSIDAAQLRNAMEGQKDLRFELKPDSLISIYTGSSEITGFWYYKRRDKQFYIILEGNSTPTPLGRLEEDKLVNRDTNEAGIIINTVFKKLEPYEEQKP